MSKGLGRIQRNIADAIKSHPDKTFTVASAAAFAYPGVMLEPKHLDVASRALNSLVPVLGLRKQRAGARCAYMLESTYQAKQAAFAAMRAKAAA